MFSAPVNQEFFGNAESGASDQAETDDKHEEKPEKKQPKASADVQDDKLSKVKAAEKPAGKAKTAAPEAKAKGQDSAKAKTKTKQTGKKGSKSAAKKTKAKTSKAGNAAVSGSQDGRDEL